MLLLIGDASARHHHHHRQPKSSYLQFVDGEFEDEELITNQSIAEAEKMHGAKMSSDPNTYHQAIAQNNRLKFEEDDSFNKVGRVNNSMENGNFIQFIPEVHVPISGPIAGVTLVEEKSWSSSDPIHGSLGPNKAKHSDLTPEQQFEQDQRNTPVAEVKEEEVTVTHTNDSIKAAEAIVGGTMADPNSAAEKKRMETSPKYHLADSDDEENDTVETRRSVKTAEKQIKHRFFINAKDERDYQSKVKAGKIPENELNWNESEDQEIGADPNVEAAKEAKKKVALIQDKAKKEAKEAENAGLSVKDIKKKEKAEE